MNEELQIELESKIAHQEHLLEELNKIVYEQDRRIIRLETVCKRLTEQFQGLSASMPGGEDDHQPPPHY